MKKITAWLKNALRSIVEGIRRFPATIGTAVSIMVLALVLVHCTSLGVDATKWLTRICLTLGLGIPLSVALQLAVERLDKKSIVLRLCLWAALYGLLTLYLFFLLPNIDKPEYGIRFAALLLASVAIVPATPYLIKKPGDEQFALKLLLRLLITALFTGVLIGGLELVLLMIDKLLNVKLWDHAYVDVAVLSFGLFSPSFLLAGVPLGSPNFKEERFQPLIKILLGYIGYPLLTAYTAIIYIYFVQILFKWSWPSNMLVNMVLWYTAIGVLALYFMRSQNAETRWFRLFDAWYPRLTVLPIVLMFIGLFIRIGAYGITEPRYFVLVLALWVSAATLLAIFFKPERRINVAVPTLLAALAVLSVFGPWSAFAASDASQNARLDNLLSKNAMLSSSGQVIAKQSIPDADKQKIYNILDYFDRNQELVKVHSLPAGTDSASLSKVLGFDRPNLPPDAQNNYESISAGQSQSTIDIAGYDHLFISGNPLQSQQPDIWILVDDQSVFTIKKGGSLIYTKDLKEYVKTLQGSYTPNKQYTPDELTFTDETSSVKVKFIINQADISITNGVSTYSLPSFYALVKVK